MRVAIIIRYHSLPRAYGFFFLRNHLFRGRGRGREDGEEKKFSKTISVVDLADKTISCVFDARVRVKARLIYDSKGMFCIEIFFTMVKAKNEYE